MLLSTNNFSGNKPKQVNIDSYFDFKLLRDYSFNQYVQFYLTAFLKILHNPPITTQPEQPFNQISWQ